MKKNQIVLVIAVNLVITAVFILVASHFILKKQRVEITTPQNYQYAKFSRMNGTFTDEVVDLSAAAKTAVNAVVHIRARFPSQKKDSSKNPPVDVFLNDMLGMSTNAIAEQRASGSGVIISDDGYIITNEHVIANLKGDIAPELIITLHNKKAYKAKLVGHDAATDLAVLKIDANNLPYLLYCNSKTIDLGQWVLAAGYPLSMETTVTAGIVSATGKRMVRKSRNENLIQSYIQTDAAANYGNSGGALVNAEGELIGIITGIVTTTGSYNGYSFAVPVSVARKIVSEIIKKAG